MEDVLFFELFHTSSPSFFKNTIALSPRTQHGNPFKQEAPVCGHAPGPADSQLLKVCLTVGLGSSSSSTSSLGTSQSLVSVLNFLTKVGGARRGARLEITPMQWQHRVCFIDISVHGAMSRRLCTPATFTYFPALSSGLLQAHPSQPFLAVRLVEFESVQTMLVVLRPLIRKLAAQRPLLPNSRRSRAWNDSANESQTKLFLGDCRDGPSPPQEVVDVLKFSVVGTSTLQSD
ncbi:hypothetical protein Q8A73_010957 [Channa argus]|nr:hypothetical protein Q8A73_010957 [Channa argus]